MEINFYKRPKEVRQEQFSVGKWSLESTNEDQKGINAGIVGQWNERDLSKETAVQ